MSNSEGARSTDYERLVALEAENERLRYEQDEMDRAVRLYETAKDPIGWADRPDIRWCTGCDQYHRTDYEHLVEDGWWPTVDGRLWRIERDRRGNLVHRFVDRFDRWGPHPTDEDLGIG